MGRSGLSGVFGGVVGALMLTLVGCGGMEGGDPGTVGGGEGDQTSESALRRRAHRPPPSQPPPMTTGTGGSSGGGGSGLTLEQVIKAAQTPDGAAIPQPSGANGACPEVVVRLGFWSCPTIGDACSFSSGGRTTHCTCQRTDGEGQFPSWICN